MLPENISSTYSQSDEKKQAFYEMEAMKPNLSAYFPSDFDPEKEYMEAIEKKYGNIG